MQVHTLIPQLRSWIQAHRLEALLSAAGTLMLALLMAMGAVAHGQVQRAQQRDAVRAAQQEEQLQCAMAARSQPQACPPAGARRLPPLSHPLG